jgi:hypothetical protein
MPTYWKYNTEHDEEVGPIDFRELVDHVREKRVDRDLKVYSVGQKKWMWASDVPGLFYMAMRPDTRGMFDDLKDDATQLGFTEDELGELLEQADAAGEELDEPSWQKRLREVARQRGLEAAEKHKQEKEERDARRIEKGIGQAAEDALERYDLKELQREKSRRVREFFSHLFSNETVGQGFAYVSAFAVANLTAFGILNWTQTELQKYPDRRGPAAAAQIFPVWGECTQMEYLLLLMPTMIIAAIAAYAVARIVVAMTD